MILLNIKGRLVEMNRDIMKKGNEKVLVFLINCLTKFMLLIIWILNHIGKKKKYKKKRNQNIVRFYDW